MSLADIATRRNAFAELQAAYEEVKGDDSTEAEQRRGVAWDEYKAATKTLPSEWHRTVRYGRR